MLSFIFDNNIYLETERKRLKKTLFFLSLNIKVRLINLERNKVYISY